MHHIGDNYPGLLDGIIPQCSFPDVGFGTIHTVADARRRLHYFNNASVSWSREELRAVSGFGVFNHIPTLSDGAARIDPVPDRPDRPSAEFDSAVPQSVRYDPRNHPAGARATVYDHTVNVYGRVPGSRFARRPLDNVGIQYGLDAFNAGVISTTQFLDLNEKIGGFDLDAHFLDTRMAADLDATRRAYASGQLLNGGGGLGSLPILDVDVLYTDLDEGGDIHMKFQHFSTRERLMQANGHADNHIMWSGGENAAERSAGVSRAAFMLRQALAQMDQWLTNLRADTSTDALLIKVIRNKPPDLVDGCWTRDDAPRFVAEPQTFGGAGTSRCNDIYPAFSSPRMMAGAPLANHVVKCQLQPIDFADYTVRFSSKERRRLRRIFPNGVCA